VELAGTQLRLMPELLLVVDPLVQGAGFSLQRRLRRTASALPDHPASPFAQRDENARVHRDRQHVHVVTTLKEAPCYAARNAKQDSAVPIRRGRNLTHATAQHWAGWPESNR